MTTFEPVATFIEYAALGAVFGYLIARIERAITGKRPEFPPHEPPLINRITSKPVDLARELKEMFDRHLY